VEHARSTYFARVESLEDGLAEVTRLYEQKYGQAVEDEEDEDDEQVCDADGTAWIKTVGCGAQHARSAYHAGLERLESALAEVTSLYEKKYGQSVDEDDEGHEQVFDTEGTPWVRSLGSGVEHARSTYFARVESLEDGLAEVTRLYEQKYGQAVEDEEDEDDEQVCDADGTSWVKTVGYGINDAQFAYYGRMEHLECALEEVKSLYKKKFGQMVDDEDGETSGYHYDTDGTPWSVTVGRGVSDTVQ